MTEGLPGWRPGGTPEWGSWYRHIAPIGAAGQSLMATPDGTPLLLLDHVEQGRVALLLSDQIWLWSRGHQGGGPQAELLRRIAHWLMKEPALDEEALRASVENNTLRIERRTVQDAAPEAVTVTTPSGATIQQPLRAAGTGRATAELPAPEPGVYQVGDGTRTAFAAAIMANGLEYADLRATASVLQPIARASGGSAHFIGKAMPELRRTELGREASGATWIGLPRRRDHVVTGLDAIPLLPPWAALPALLILVVVPGGRKARDDRAAERSHIKPAVWSNVSSRRSSHLRAGRIVRVCLALIGFVGLCLLVWISNGAITAANVSGWYHDLFRPPGSPPDWVFGPVWTVLYLTIGVSAWLVWRRVEVANHRKRAALRLWGWQLLLNAVWPSMFFGLHSPGLAMVAILALLGSIALTVRAFVPLQRGAALLLLPYFGWVCFAAFLNAGFWWLNGS